MFFSQDVLLILLLSIFTSTNDVDLNTNSNFLLLLLLVLSMDNGFLNNGCGCRGNRDFFWYIRSNFLTKKEVNIKFISF